MNYQKIYDAIIAKRQSAPHNGYVEVHHILPKSLGGLDTKSNLVALSAREHFICHLLLVKIHENSPNYYKMVKAFFMMQAGSDNQQRLITSKKYERLRLVFSNAQRIQNLGKNNPSYGKVWCVKENAKDCKERKMFVVSSIPDGWITTKEMKRRLKLSVTEDRAAKKLLEKQKSLRKMHRLYCSVGFDDFVVQTGYKHSKQNLVQQFAKWLPEFIPQNGKRR